MGKSGREAILTGRSTLSKKQCLVPKRQLLKPSRISSKVLKEALIQQKEIYDEEVAKANDPFSTIAEDNLNNSEEDDDEEDINNFEWFSKAQSEEVDEEEEKILEAFMSKDVSPQRTLADIVLRKIREKDNHVSSGVRPHVSVDYSIIDLYKGVGKFLSKYTTGKLPKAFKRIPSLKNWVDVLYLTEPEKWSANAVYQATRIFASNLPHEKAKYFYSLVLLPRIREDIRKNKRLHFSLFQALKKSIYKAPAFNKGILFPLCKSGTCTLWEAVIIGSVIQKISIPSHHPGAALLKLAEMEYRGTTSYFIKLLLDKKYCLAYRVLDGLVAHFMRFLEDTRAMPVIWHQSLLSLVQGYKNGLTTEDKANLERLVDVHSHYLVTPEIKRELNNSRSRGEKEDSVFTNYSASTITEDRFDIPDVPMEED